MMYTYSRKHPDPDAPRPPRRRYCPPPPEPLPPAKLPYRFRGLSCSPKHHIAFLKTHRSGSSAVQNILFQFAARHQLVPLLPPAGAQLLGDQPFHASDRCNVLGRKLGLHLINVAIRWNHPQVTEVAMRLARKNAPSTKCVAKKKLGTNSTQNVNVYYANISSQERKVFNTLLALITSERAQRASEFLRIYLH